MLVDRSLIGLTSEPRTFEVTSGAIVALAEAIGDPCPAYREGRIAPPTFPDTFQMVFPKAFPGLEDFDLTHGLLGEMEFAYERALRAGDRVTCVARIVDVTEKELRRGTATFVVFETNARDEAGSPVYTSRATVIVR